MISAGYMVRATYLAVTRVLQKRLQAYRLTSPQWYFMREIWIQEGLSQRELSERVGTAESTTVSALRVLERRRLIFRESAPRDRRASRVYLTDAGRRLRDDVIPIIDAVNKVAIGGLPHRDVENLERILAHIRQNLWRSLEEIERLERTRKRARPPRRSALSHRMERQAAGGR
jgi:DNA-binding MarR family transcriptional regulator